MANESIVLDGLDLNDYVTWYVSDDPPLEFIQAKKKFGWVESALSDGARLRGSEDKYTNAELIFTPRLMPQPDIDTARALGDVLTTKLNKARDLRSGLPLVWTRAGSAFPSTWYVVGAEYDEIRASREGGWFTNDASAVVHLYMRPFGYESERQIMLGLSDPFVIDSITNGLWRWDTADHGMAITGSPPVLAMTSGTGVAKRLYRASTMVDQTATVRFRTGSTLAGSSIALNARRQNSTDRLACDYDGSSGTIRIRRVTSAGGAVTLGTPSAVTLSTTTFYYLQASWDGNDISVGIFADDPGPFEGGTPLASANWTLTGADVTNWGVGIRGNPAISVTPADLGWQVDHWWLRDVPDIRNSEPIVGFEVLDVPGQVSAEGRMVVKEDSSQNRSHLEWGRETRNFDPEIAWPFIIDSDAMVTSGFAGTQQPVGQYDPNLVNPSGILATPLSETVSLTICGTGNQLHVGVFKVKAHVGGTTGVFFRLASRVGAGGFDRGNWSEPILGTDFQEVDLGTITVPEAGVGTQTWEGRVEAMGVSGGAAIVDYLELVPLEVYGVERAPLQPILPTTYTAFDHFNQGSATVDGASLAQAPADGKWHTSGGAGDYSFDLVNHQMQRTQTLDTALNAGRYALVGTTSFAGVQWQGDFAVDAALPLGVDFTDKLRFGLVLRYVDANNWWMVVRQTRSVQSGIGVSFDHRTRLRVYKRIAGTITQVGDYGEQAPPETHRTLICSIDAAGVWQVYSYWTGAKQPAEPQLTGQDPVLASSGVLASGKFGTYDAYVTRTDPVKRTVDNVVAFVPATDAVLFSGRTIEVRADRTEREAAGGGNFGPTPLPRSGRLYLPPAGDSGRISRIAGKLRRTDVDDPGLPDGTPASDAAIWSVFATPRRLTP